MQSDEQAIREVVQTWIDASKAGDGDRVLSLMQDDVVFLTVGQQPFGKATFEAASRAGKGKVKIDADMDLREVTVVGDVGYTLNHLTITIAPTQGEQRVMSGHILTVFRKQPDGRWLLARDANLLTPQPRPKPLQAAIAVLQVERVARSIAWYRDIVGFDVNPFGPPDAPVFAILYRDGVELMLQCREGPATPLPTDNELGLNLYVRVADVDALHARVKLKHPEVSAIVQREYGCREFRLRDPDGHVLVFGQCED